MNEPGATDRERLVALLADFGLAPVLHSLPSGGTIVTLQAKHGGVGGYSGFTCDFQFTPEGEYAAVDVWE